MSERAEVELGERSGSHYKGWGKDLEDSEVDCTGVRK